MSDDDRITLADGSEVPRVAVGRGIRFTDDPAICTHTGIKVCPECARLTDEEVAAIRKFLAILDGGN